MNEMISITLRYTPGIGFIRLRELNGYDEMKIHGTDTGAAIRLVNSLLHPDASAEPGISAEKFVTADRDHILAAIYVHHFGKQVKGKSRCRHCTESFEIDFLLPELEQHLQTPLPGSDLSPFVYTAGNSSFRLPTGEDELTVAAFPAEKAIDELLQRCLLSGSPDDRMAIQTAMANIAPVLQTEISSVCPFCASAQEIRFDIQSYLMNKLKQEQSKLFHDTHRLASVYHWSHHSILEMPRRLRRKYVALIEAEIPV